MILDNYKPNDMVHGLTLYPSVDLSKMNYEVKSTIIEIAQHILA